LSDPRNIIVYRDRLLPKSEVEFMRRQYLSFERLVPVWSGRVLERWLERGRFQVGPVLSGLGGVMFKFFGIIARRREFEALNAVCVHAQFGRGGALALPLAQALGLPLVVTFHGSEVDKASYYRWFPPSLFRLRMERLKAYASAFVCISENVRERLIARGFPAEKTVAIPIGTDVIASGPRDAPGSGILFVGRFAEMKGIPVLLAAIRLLRARGCSEVFTLIGDGPERAAVLREVGELAGVVLPGWQSPEAVKAAMAAARALCVPSLITQAGESEGLPSVVMEAMGLGVPVIASSEARVEGLVRDGVTGFVFESKNAQALAQQIETLLGAPERAAQIAAAGWAHVAAHFNARQQSKKLEELLLQTAKL
jgi:glycosyltransferase involved in cell wall biosynthesis